MRSDRVARLLVSQPCHIAVCAGTPATARLALVLQFELASMRFALCLVLCAALAATAALENTRHLVLGCFGAGYLGHVPGFVIHAPTHCKDVKNGNGSAAVYEALFQEAGERAVGLNGATGETPWWLAVSPAHTVAISPPEALELLQDKVRFAAWMEADPEVRTRGGGRGCSCLLHLLFTSTPQLAPHAPATYLSLDTAVYPAILKLKPLSTRGNGISIVHDAAEAAAAVGNTTGYLIQEAVLSEHEYSVKFAAYNGTLLGVGQASTEGSRERDHA